jgi:hypothetical protein
MQDRNKNRDKYGNINRKRGLDNKDPEVREKNPSLF